MKSHWIIENGMYTEQEKNLLLSGIVLNKKMIEVFLVDDIKDKKRELRDYFCRGESANGVGCIDGVYVCGNCEFINELFNVKENKK